MEARNQRVGWLTIVANGGFLLAAVVLPFSAWSMKVEHDDLITAIQEGRRQPARDRLQAGDQLSELDLISLDGEKTTLPELSLAQSPSMLIADSAPSCTDCELTLEEIARLGNQHGRGALCTGTIVHLARDSSGRYYAAPTCEPGAINVYSSDGSFVSSIVLSPLEQDRDIIRLWVSPEDHLYVANRGHRIDVVSLDGTPIRVEYTPASVREVLFLDDGSTIRHFLTRTRDQIGLPLHHVDNTGAILESFGADERLLYGGAPLPSRLVDLEGNFVWSAKTHTYTIERWTTSDRSVDRRVERGATWSAGIEPIFDWATRDIRYADPGKLWMMLSIYPDPWPRSQHRPSPGEIDNHVDTLIEVLDIERGRLRASGTSSEPLLGWIGKDVYSLVAVNQPGKVAIVVWRASFRDPSHEKG